MRPLPGASVVLTSALLANSGLGVGSAQALIVSQITEDGRAVSSASGITVRNLNGTVLSSRLRISEPLPSQVQIDVPGHVSILVSSGRSRLTLEPNSSDTFVYTGVGTVSGVEQVVVNYGTTEVDDPFDFYHVVSHSVSLTHHTTIFSISTSAHGLNVTCTDGALELELLGATSAYARRVDEVAATGRPSVEYDLGKETNADVSFADDYAAASRGDTDGEYDLGVRYADGTGVRHNYDIALRWLSRAATKGNRFAYNALGFLYEHGLGVRPNALKALHWYELAAARGLPAAENNLGYLYDGTDFPAALRWYRLAAAKGDAAAEFHVGVMYDLGHGVRQNYGTALDWYELSAAQGNAFAEYSIGHLFERGDGITANDRLALHWYSLAAAHGSPDARAAVLRVCRRLSC